MDAAHPGGAVMDAMAGVQHIFTYAGTFNPAGAGDYRITRTLDTARLSSKRVRKAPLYPVLQAGPQGPAVPRLRSAGFQTLPAALEKI